MWEIILIEAYSPATARKKMTPTFINKAIAL